MESFVFMVCSLAQSLILKMVYLLQINLKELVLTTVIMAPARVEPRVGAPKNGPFPDLSDLRDRVPGASFGCTETMISAFLGGEMTSGFHLILIFRAEIT